MKWHPMIWKIHELSQSHRFRHGLAATCAAKATAAHFAWTAVATDFGYVQIS
jgi:hypothetical protein